MHHIPGVSLYGRRASERVSLDLGLHATQRPGILVQFNTTVDTAKTAPECELTLAVLGTKEGTACHSVGSAMKMLALRGRQISALKKRARRVLASINVVQQRLGKLDRRKPTSVHIFEIRPRADEHGFDLSSDALPFSPMWYRGSNAIGDAVRCARSYSRSHPVVVRLYDDAGNVIETLEYRDDFQVS
jgi:hypothetical protein